MKIYKLEQITSPYLIDMDFDATSEAFDNKEIIEYDMTGVEIFNMPKEIYFRANFHVIPEHTDFPITDLTFPIFSKKMIDVIESVKPFPKKLLQTIMVDDTYLEHYLDENGVLKKDVKINTTYFGVQFLEHTNCFNYEKSIFRPLSGKPNFPGVIKKLVLRMPKSGFPSVFKMKEKRSLTFITQETKEALERNNIKSCAFEEVEVSE